MTELCKVTSFLFSSNEPKMDLNFCLICPDVLLLRLSESLLKVLAGHELVLQSPLNNRG